MDFMKHLYVDGHEHEFEFKFFSTENEGEKTLCLVKSKLVQYPIIMGRHADGSWVCLSHAPVIIAHLKNDLSRAIIDYKILKECL